MEQDNIIVISEDRVVDDTYCVDGFEIHDFVKQKDCVTFRTNVKSKEDFERWKNIFFERWKNIFFLKNNVCFNSFKMFSVGKIKLFRQQLMCHHGKETHIGIKKTYTGCKVFMDATIRLVHTRSPEDIRSFPCFMKIMGHHNHPLDTADVLNQLRVSPCILHETNIAVAELLKTSEKFGNEDSVSALKMFVQRLRSVKTSNQFNSFLHTVGVGVCVQKGAGRGKIPVQPTSIARRSEGMPRGATPLGKGRRPLNCNMPKAKRPRNLAENVRNNVANAKSHGSGH